MTKALGFIGLGVMGFPMAGHLSEHNQIAVFNRTKTKSEIWSTKYEGKICSSPHELAKISDVIILCVGDDNDVRDIVCLLYTSPSPRDGLLSRMPSSA